MYKCKTENVIEELIAATHGTLPGLRSRHVLAQALHGLVRLAKAEQLTEIRMDTERASGALASLGRRRQTRAILRKIGMDVSHRQRELEFDQLHGAQLDREGRDPCPDCQQGPP